MSIDSAISQLQLKIQYISAATPGKSRQSFILREYIIYILLTPLTNTANVFCVSALSGLANSTAGMSLCTCRIAWYSINNYWINFNHAKGVLILLTVWFPHFAYLIARVYVRACALRRFPSLPFSLPNFLVFLPTFQFPWWT